MSLDKCYLVFERSSIVYWLSVPWLLVVWVLQGRPVERISFDSIFYTHCVEWVKAHKEAYKRV